jgi:hypothetical protein
MRCLYRLREKEKEKEKENPENNNEICRLICCDKDPEHRYPNREQV